MLLNYKQTFQDIQENSFLETLNGLNKTILVLKAIAMENDSGPVTSKYTFVLLNT